MGDMMPKGLNIIEKEKVYINDAPDYLHGFPYEFYCYVSMVNVSDDSDESREKYYGPVLKWCVLNATDEWEHCFIIECSRHAVISDDEKQSLDKDNPALVWWMSACGNGEYIDVLKVNFKSQQDAIHFKMVWG